MAYRNTDPEAIKGFQKCIYGRGKGERFWVGLNGCVELRVEWEINFVQLKRGCREQICGFI